MDEPRIESYGDHLNAVREKMRQYGSPQAPAIPVKRPKQDAQEHAGKKSLELQVKRGKQGSREDYTCPWAFKALDKNALQSSPETGLFTDSRQDGNNKYIDKEI